MRFSLENAIEQFDFKDASLESFQKDDALTMSLVAAIGKGTNPLNEEYVDRYIDVLQLRFLGGKILSILKEGYKYYDANDVLQLQVPDQEISPLEYDAVIRECVANKAYVFRMEETRVEQGYQYTIYFDIEKEETTTYLITIAFEKSVAEWEFFQNRVMG